MSIFLFCWMILELAVIILVGEWLGVLATISLLILTTLLGFLILRSESFAVINRIQTRLQQRKPPKLADFDSSIVMMAGMLLIIPGFVSDIIGLICWMPGVRHALKRAARKNAPSKKSEHESNVIEGEFQRKDKTEADDKSSNDEHKH